MRSLPAALRLHVERAPDHPCITCDGLTLSRAEFDSRTNRLARAYAALGVRQGDFVTIALPNGIEFYEAAAAVWKLGATPQPVSAKLPLSELQAIVALARPRLVIGGPQDLGFSGTVLAAGYVPSSEFEDGALQDCVSTSWRAPTSGGSTGRPKLIVSRQPALFDPDAPFMEMRSDQTQLVAGPLYHNAPFSLSSIGLTRGHHLVVMKRFDACEALRLIAACQVNWLMLVPTMMSRIWRLGDAARAAAEVSSIETLWHMAAPCPIWLKDAWIDWIGAEKIWELYGGTEGQGMTTIRGDAWLRHRGSVGRPQDGFEVRILREDGSQAPTGEVGEIYMRPKSGQGSTYYYVGAEPKSAVDGFESLGDMGSVDADGYLYLADRLTDMILSGGANIYPAEVESALEAHPLVRSSAVIGLPDDDLGAAVHAIVEVSAPLSQDALLEFAATILARYKLPRTVEFVSEPLRDDAGKVRRSALRAARLATLPHVSG